MKLIIFLLLLTSPVYAKVAMDMKAGYWEYKTDIDMSPFLKQAMAGLEKLPKAQRDQALKAMKSSSGSRTHYQCITKEDLNNWEKKVKDSFSKSKQSKDCKIKIVSSTKKSFNSKLICKDASRNLDINIAMKNSKEGITTVSSAISPSPIKSKMKWISGTCKEKKKEASSSI